MTSNDPTQPTEADLHGINAAITLVRAYPQIVLSDNTGRPSAEVRQEIPAFHEVMRSELQALRDRYDDDTTVGVLVSGLTVLAAMVTDRLAVNLETTRDEVLNILAYNTLVESMTEFDDPE